MDVDGRWKNRHTLPAYTVLNLASEDTATGA
jgi:hypothetical protein